MVASIAVACSTAKAIEWDKAFQELMAVNGECSGRAVGGVHEQAYTNLLDEVKGVSAASRVAAKEADGGGPTAKRAKR